MRNPAPAGALQRKITRLMNVILLTFITISLFFAVVHGVWGTGTLALLNLANAAVLGAILLLNYFNLTHHSRMALILVTNASIFAFTWMVGWHYGVQFALITAAMLPLLLLGLERPWLTHSLAALSLGLLLAVESLKPAGTISTHFQPGLTAAIRLILLGLAGAVPIFFTLRYYRENKRHTDELSGAIGKLESANRTILEQQQQLLSASKAAALAEMARGMAHEINNPLAIIKLRTQILEGTLAAEGPAGDARHTVADSLSVISSMVARTAKIVQGLLDFSREGERDPVERVPVAALIEGVLSLCGEKLKAKAIDLRKDKVPGDLTVLCQRLPVSQALMNILNNSVDALSGAPEKWIEIEAFRRNGVATIAVRDSGAGIADEIADKVFQPFFTTKDVGQGTGLGLSAAKGLVEHQGGKLYLDRSSPRTRFVMELPVAKSAATP